MNQDIKKYLPIGSVVILKNGTKKVMVTGYMQIDMGNKTQVFDYCGCIYPVGIMRTDQNLLFNHDDIKQVYCIGYSDEEQKEFSKKLDSITEDDLKNMLEKAKELQ